MRTENNNLFPFLLRRKSPISGGAGDGSGPKVGFRGTSVEVGGLGRSAIRGGSSPMRRLREIMACVVVGCPGNGRNSSPESCGRHKWVKGK